MSKVKKILHTGKMKNYRLKCLLVVIILADDHAFAQDDAIIGIGKVF